MPWNMEDYPDSLKNFDKVIRKKAIEIANALLDEDYSESSAIAIGTEKAKEWHESASKEEIGHFRKYGKTT